MRIPISDLGPPELMHINIEIAVSRSRYEKQKTSLNCNIVKIYAFTEYVNFEFFKIHITKGHPNGKQRDMMGHREDMLQIIQIIQIKHF